MPDIFVAKQDKKTENPKSREPQKETVIHVDPDEVKDVGKEIGLFRTFSINPAGIKLENQAPDEKIVLFLRRHLITNVPWIFRTVVLLLVPALLSFVSRLFDISFSFLPAQYNFFILLFYFYLVFIFAFVDFISWFYNIGLATNKRVIDVDLNNLVNTHFAATKISQIEDVGSKRTGALRAIFDYGDVEIQTAAESGNFEFLAVPNPTQAVHIIEDLIKGGKE